MKALVYHGPGRKTWEQMPDPTIVDPTDAVVAVDTTTICGTDLHILKGDVPTVTEGRILGHEGVATITQVGPAVGTLAEGDRVIISCITSCGSCSYCHQQLPAHCLDDEGASGIGWVLGHLIDGTQAEFVRVPFAENSLHRLPEGVSDAAAVMLSDILPTGFEIGVRNGRVKPGDVVAVVGAGPVGLAAMMTAGLYGASPRHRDRSRRQPRRAGQESRRHRQCEQRRCRSEGRSPRHDRRRPGGGCRDRGGRGSGHLRGRHRTHPAGLRGGERRSARPVGGTSTSGPVDQRRGDHHRFGQHHHDTDAAETRRPGKA